MRADADVADDRAPLDALQSCSGSAEAPVDDGAGGLGEQPPATRGRGHPVAELACSAEGDAVQADHAGEGFALADRPGRFDALAPAVLRERDEALRMLPFVRGRHRRVPLDVGILTRLEDRVDIGLAGHRQREPRGAQGDGFHPATLSARGGTGSSLAPDNAVRTRVSPRRGAGISPSAARTRLADPEPSERAGFLPQCRHDTVLLGSGVPPGRPELPGFLGARDGSWPRCFDVWTPIRARPRRA